MHRFNEKKLLFCLTLFSTSFLFAQNNQYKIEYEQKAFGGYRYFQNTNKISTGQLKYILSNNTEAYRQFKSAQSNTILASSIGFIGGFILGWTATDFFLDNDPNWQIGFIGAAASAMSIPINSTAKKQARKAVDYYNTSISYGYKIPNKLYLRICENRIGLKLKFH